MTARVKIEVRHARSLHAPRRGARSSRGGDVHPEDLRRSIQRFGVLQPIVAKSDGEVIIGQRRSEAAKRLGLEIPVIVRDDLDDEVAALESRLSEEMAHQPWERLSLAEEIRKLYEAHKKRDDKFTRAKLAERLGVSDDTIANYFTLAGLPEEVKEKVQRGDLSPWDARTIGEIADLTEKEKVKLAKKVAESKIPGGRKLEEEVAPLIRKVPETIRSALIQNPRTTYEDVRRHIARRETKQAKAADGVAQSIQGFAAGVIQRVRYWRGALSGLQRAEVLPLFSDHDWVRFEAVIRELIDEAQACLKTRDREAQRKAKELIEAKPERVRNKVDDAQERWVAATEN